MSIIRTDHEADGVEILKLVIETTHYYREMADVLEDDSLSAKLDKLSNERAAFIEPSREMVKALGQLPAEPDPDKELMQKIGGELTNFFSADAKNAILDNCLQEDEKLAEVVNNTKLGEKSAEFQQLLDALSGNLNNTQKSVQALKD